jgi:hypothetical protein
MNNQSQIFLQVSGDEKAMPGIFFGLPAHEGDSDRLVEQAPGTERRAFRRMDCGAVLGRSAAPAAARLR